MKDLSEVVHQLRSEEVKAERQCAGEREGGGEDGFESHRGKA
jgi:hypothetical protein